MGKRDSGILLHVTSLPSEFGIGDLGPQSYCFADLLAAQKQHYWSILPLNPTRLSDGNSPYLISSAFAGNPLLISPEKLFEAGLLPKKLASTTTSPKKVDYVVVYKQKEALLEQAYVTFQKTKTQPCDAAFDFEAFCAENAAWLDDYALYVTLRKKLHAPWHLWPSSLRRHVPEAMNRTRAAFRNELLKEKFVQCLFFSQMSSLKAYCNKRQIHLLGDVPFYVAHDSADVWAHPTLFKLYNNGKPRYVGGVPPDYFSATGQLWGNPVYDWKRMEAEAFEWWLSRIRHNLTLCDLLRLDHFRGFVAYWQVSGCAKTALRGHWVNAPSKAFFGALKKLFPSLPFIAEDLGYIDAPVRAAIKRWHLPGMKVLLFGFDGDPKNPHHPKNHPQNAAVYTGTHDTNTARGWFSTEASAKEKANLANVLGKRPNAGNVSLELVKLALTSKADLCILPLQDVLGLGADARMNHPSQPFHNWEWRVTTAQLKSPRLAELAGLTAKSGRAG